MRGSEGGADVWDHGVALLERTVELEPVLASAGDARRFVRSFLGDAGHDEWFDAAELAVSEVVTNAALHAHTTIELRLLAFDDRARVEVRDRNPSIPRQRDHDEQATTGRGMALVAALTLECGVHSLGADGKVVWFCVGDVPEPTVDALLDAWDVDAWDVDLRDEGQGGGGEDATVEVVLSGLPPTLWSSARQHHDALLRELVLHRATHGGTGADLAPADRARTLLSEAVLAAVEAAHTEGTATVPPPGGGPGTVPRASVQLDVRLRVGRGAGWELGALQDALDEGESLAVAGQLLLSPGLPEIVAVRDWACEQVVAQLGGAEAAPWAGADQVRFETEVRVGARDHGWEASVVESAATPVIAADEANRILAVSGPLADLLGWRAEDLVGRRVVTLVPPALREAHVAGYSRHLTTGEVHLLGTSVDLPVLTADGREVPCRFLIEQAPSATGRTVYVAWIEPL